MTRKITALPSLVVSTNGKEKELDSLEQIERQSVITSLCTIAGSIMSDYYNTNHEEWRKFIRKMSA